MEFQKVSKFWQAKALYAETYIQACALEKKLEDYDRLISDCQRQAAYLRSRLENIYEAAAADNTDMVKSLVKTLMSRSEYEIFYQNGSCELCWHEEPFDCDEELIDCDRDDLPF